MFGGDAKLTITNKSENTIEEILVEEPFSKKINIIQNLKINESKTLPIEIKTGEVDVQIIIFQKNDTLTLSHYMESSYSDEIIIFNDSVNFKVGSELFQ
jgi:hypothetical protein